MLSDRQGGRPVIYGDEEFLLATKLELDRRMSIAAAVVSGARPVLIALIAAQGWLNDFRKSRLLAWSGGVAIAFIALGYYVGSLFYFVAMVACSPIFTRLEEIWTQQKIEKAQLARLDELRILWIAGGHFETDLNALHAMARRSDGFVDCDSDEYAAWWQSVRRHSVDNLSSIERSAKAQR